MLVEVLGQSVEVSDVSNPTLRAVLAKASRRMAADGQDWKDGYSDGYDNAYGDADGWGDSAGWTGDSNSAW